MTNVLKFPLQKDAIDNVNKNKESKYFKIQRLHEQFTLVEMLDKAGNKTLYEMIDETEEYSFLLDDGSLNIYACVNFEDKFYAALIVHEETGIIVKLIWNKAEVKGYDIHNLAQFLLHSKYHLINRWDEGLVLTTKGFISVNTDQPLPAVMSVVGDLTIEGSQFIELPDELEVKGKLTLSKNIAYKGPQYLYAHDLEVDLFTGNRLAKRLVVRDDMTVKEMHLISETIETVTVGGNFSIEQSFFRKQFCNYMCCRGEVIIGKCNRELLWKNGKFSVAPKPDVEKPDVLGFDSFGNYLSPGRSVRLVVHPTHDIEGAPLPKFYTQEDLIVRFIRRFYDGTNGVLITHPSLGERFLCAVETRHLVPNTPAIKPAPIAHKEVPQKYMKWLNI